jgi:hypothetical protein
MNLSPNLNVALKEWAVVCSALEAGRQIILLRKGGIYESAGEFEIEHRQFLFFPTFLHQNSAMLKSADITPVAEEPPQLEISAAGIITDIIQMPSRTAMDALDDQHIWSRPLIDMRYNYRPENPLYLLLNRTWRLREPVTIANTPAYAGCKSWVPLESSIDTTGAAPALDDREYDLRRRTILDRIASS